ncbi:transcriptional repressor [Pelomyxa schiedti]|nr:transcriptional repressor [Pelomyxa schiedti]
MEEGMESAHHLLELSGSSAAATTDSSGIPGDVRAVGRGSPVPTTNASQIQQISTQEHQKQNSSFPIASAAASSRPSRARPKGGPRAKRTRHSSISTDYSQQFLYNPDPHPCPNTAVPSTGGPISYLNPKDQLGAPNRDEHNEAKSPQPDFASLLQLLQRSQQENAATYSASQYLPQLFQSPMPQSQQQPTVTSHSNLDTAASMALQLQNLLQAQTMVDPIPYVPPSGVTHNYAETIEQTPLPSPSGPVPQSPQVDAATPSQDVRPSIPCLIVLPFPTGDPLAALKKQDHPQNRYEQHQIQQIIQGISARIKLFCIFLEQLKQSHHLLQHIPITEFAVGIDQLGIHQQQLYDSMASEQETLNRLSDEYILSPQDIYAQRKLDVQLQMNIKQLELYQLELLHTVRPEIHPCPAALFLTDHPFPRAIVKGQTIPVAARLLQSAEAEIHSVGTVTASIVQHHQSTKKNVKYTVFLESSSEKLDSEGNVRSNVRFLVGTNKKPVTLRLHVSIKHVPHLRCLTLSPVEISEEVETHIIESNQSRPFIITTNSIQWRDSEGILFKMDTFGDMIEVSWERFANIFQAYYLAATRQNLEFPIRPITLKDFAYLSYVKFGGLRMISIAAFDRFWEWFGPAIEKIRHQKCLAPMWAKGLMLGFASKNDCENVLLGYPEGTCVIKFSEQYPGRFAIAYMYKGQVHHSLLKDSDVAGNKKSVVEALHEVGNIRSFLQVKSDFQGKVQYAPISKPPPPPPTTTTGGSTPRVHHGKRGARHAGIRGSAPALVPILATTPAPAPAPDPVVASAETAATATTSVPVSGIEHIARRSITPGSCFLEFNKQRSRDAETTPNPHDEHHVRVLYVIDNWLRT